MEILDALVWGAGLMVAALLGAWLLMKRKPRKSPEERVDAMLAKIASDLGYTLEGHTLKYERSGLKMNYEFRVSVSEEKGIVHNSFSAETGFEPGKFFVVRPASPKIRTEIYPKTEATEYFAAKIKNILESDVDAVRLNKDGYAISVSTGGICISPKMGLFMGKKNAVNLDISGEISKEGLFHGIFSDRESEAQEAEYTDEWKGLVERGFGVLEKIARTAGEG